MRWMTGVLTPRKVTIRRSVVVSPSNSYDDLPLMKHDARVDLNHSGVRVHYTEEPTLLAESPPHSPPPYIMSGCQIGSRYGKVLIPTPNHKGKGHTESASSNSAPRVGQRCPPPKIHGPPGMMEFSDENTKEEKEEPSDELVVTLN
jgi:hypothetical protein